MSQESPLIIGKTLLTRAATRALTFLAEGGAPKPKIEENLMSAAALFRDQGRLAVVGMLNPKGGSGKSTTGINLAVASHYAGEKAAIVDLDTKQRTAFEWARLREAAPKVIRREAAHLADAIAEAREKRYSFLVLDTPGQDTVAATAVIRCSDLVLVPVQPSWADVVATKRLLCRLATAGVRFGVVLTRVHDTSRTRNSRYREALSRHGHVLDCDVPSREAFSDAAGHGLAVFELGGEQALRASDRISRLYSEVCTLVQEP